MDILKYQLSTRGILDVVSSIQVYPDMKPVSRYYPGNSLILIVHHFPP